MPSADLPCSAESNSTVVANGGAFPRRRETEGPFLTQNGTELSLGLGRQLGGTWCLGARAGDGGKIKSFVLLSGLGLTQCNPGKATELLIIEGMRYYTLSAVTAIVSASRGPLGVRGSLMNCCLQIFCHLRGKGAPGGRSPGRVRVAPCESSRTEVVWGTSGSNRRSRRSSCFDLRTALPLGPCPPGGAFHRLRLQPALARLRKHRAFGGLVDTVPLCGRSPFDETRG